jgi:pyruvate formate lyase activating enzyme
LVKKPSYKSLQAQSHLTKRAFLKACGKVLCSLGVARLFSLPGIVRAQRPEKGLVRAKLSPYFSPLKGGTIQCELCPRRCVVPQGKRGFCRVRENREGKYYSLVYGNPCVLYLDKIEREPFFHVLPGTSSLTLSTAGCNFRCKFCENWEVSQAFPEDVYSQEFSPELVVKKAVQMGAHSIAYTYAEPTVFYEYMADIAHHARKEGLLNIIHSNGFINPGPLRELCKVIDAAHIDLKGFTPACYRELSEGKQQPVLKALKVLKQENIHLEVSTLLIPTKNDEMSVVKDLALWVKRELGADTPLHLSRFYPLYKLKRLPPTPVSTLEKARETAISSGLEYVYIGRVPGHEAWNTFCPRCQRPVIQRTGYMIEALHLTEGKCAYCKNPIPGIWDLTLSAG